MIEVGQLRRWNDPHMIDGATDVFLVIENLGLFFRADGAIDGTFREVTEDHWRVLHDGKLHSGWSNSLLEELSEVVHGTA